MFSKFKGRATWALLRDITEAEKTLLPYQTALEYTRGHEERKAAAFQMLSENPSLENVAAAVAVANSKEGLDLAANHLVATMSGRHAAIFTARKEQAATAAAEVIEHLQEQRREIEAQAGEIKAARGVSLDTAEANEEIDRLVEIINDALARVNIAPSGVVDAIRLVVGVT